MRTLSEANELEQGDVGMRQHFALLIAGGGGVHLQPHNPVSDGQLDHECALKVPTQGAIIFWVYELCEVLLTAHVHLHSSSATGQVLLCAYQQAK